jgi:rSAM/selenodomain-associated transferase 2
MHLSIIIPVFNEVARIVDLLEYLQHTASSKHLNEIIVVDGGSTDGSIELIEFYIELKKEVASKHSTPIKLQLIHSQKGRARQMNLGTKVAKGDVLYFLHADSFPPKNYSAYILEAVNKGNAAGCFRMRFDSPNTMLKISQWFTRFNVKICRGGDQSLFVSKKLFTTLNGYDEQYKVYEDNEFIGRLYETAKFKVIPAYITSSSRRYTTNGNWKLQYHFSRIHLKNMLGASADELYAYYQENIAS